MQHTIKCTKSLTGLVALLGLGASLHVSAETVQQIAGAPGHTVWMITEPRVNASPTAYPQIAFKPGETVTVNAVGCVQTGGSGLTWKRYADPAGSESDRLYHGQVSIPGATNGLQFLGNRLPITYTIPSSASVPASQMHLTLGYTDDGLSDNGYYKRNSDNGNDNQCWGLGNAQVTIDIAPIPLQMSPPPSASYTLTIENIEIRNLRSKRSDTDVLAAAVTVDGTQSAIAKQAIGDVSQGVHPVSFHVLVDSVAPTDRVAIAYSVVNAGNPSDQKIDDAVVSGVKAIGGSVPVVGSFLSAFATGFQQVFNLLDPNCDGPVVADTVMATGADLARWTQDGGLLRRTASFDGIDSAAGCGNNSFYEVTYTIKREDPNQLQPYSLKVNAKGLHAAVANNVTLLGHNPLPDAVHEVPSGALKKVMP
jgi:hypothetical protein